MSAGITLEDQETDKKNTTTLKAGKVRDIITCVDYQKACCVYSAKSLTLNQECHLKRIKDDTWYVCGDSLEEDLPFITRQAISCASPIETPYYRNSNCQFPPVCSHCGTGEQLLDDFSEYMEVMFEKYSVVRPICERCRAPGKEASTWGRKCFKKKRLS